ncbi:unnamed protein product [Arabidopsis thaliana]|uniref:Uncharacterized protein n=2 Tax=Arabidopsis thaliana TaxID=3702 RepID=A0A654FUN6_ARATH|nr:uncharacterized protein AT4G31715 [Arabidopsis thaliana]ANM66521.1 hypothetical protein AT4G31715 [Arabidopsis thaliana]CAA0397163.1 unnamed protein product [Arabidopsis thaliana]VYS64569.1 unnamed protein product [Arabidopsis thaliana]|eukprot:NP_001328411.1 hypothetical protein AT4G31715 [Arabidopsis thaliana]
MCSCLQCSVVKADERCRGYKGGLSKGIQQSVAMFQVRSEALSIQLITRMDTYLIFTTWRLARMVDK